MIAQHSIEAVLNAAVIEDVVGDYVTLKRAGSRFKGLCPFHDEKTPSFVVSPTMGIYKCFGCQKGGNALNFIMEMENQNYVEAARALAKRYGIELEESGIQDDDSYRENQKLRENIQIVLEYAQKFFTTNLEETEEGRTIALEYFKERGFTMETMHKWGLGYSPMDWEALATKAKQDGYTLETLELAGLVRKRDTGSYFDLFRNRVMFPIHSVSGKIIAFAGRKMSSTDPAPKYVNSPETELYKKSEILYGIFQAKNAIKKEDKVYLTEGYTDVITLGQYGVENVVASSGTALTPGQIKLLRRFTPNITVVYDGDKAGIKASLRGINLLLSEGLNVRVVALPEGEDPDSWCKNLGSEGFKEYLQKEEKNFIFFKAELLLQGAENDPIRKTEAVRDILESVAEIADPLKRNALNHELSRICGMDEALLASELNKLVRKKVPGKGQEILKELKQLTEAAGIDMPREALTDENQERDLIKQILLYGDRMVDENNTIIKKTIEEIGLDEILVFNDELSSKILKELKILDLDNWNGYSFFLNHKDSEISSWSAGILSNQNILSKAFEENFIFVPTESDNYRADFLSTFNYLRYFKLDKLIRLELEKLKLIKEEIDKLKLENEPNEILQMKYEESVGIMEYCMFLNDEKIKKSKENGIFLGKIQY